MSTEVLPLWLVRGMDGKKIAKTLDCGVAGCVGGGAPGILYLTIMTAPPFGKPFLTAEWRQLARLNYEIDGKILQPWAPRGTELDSVNGKTFVSIVGFRFEKTRVLGVAIPFHENFEEINLRFYVRHKAACGRRSPGWPPILQSTLCSFAHRLCAAAVVHRPD